MDEWAFFEVFSIPELRARIYSHTVSADVLLRNRAIHLLRHRDDLSELCGDEAAENGDMILVTMLRERGAEFTGAAIEYAAMKGHLRVVRYLFSVLPHYAPTHHLWAGIVHNGHVKVLARVLDEYYPDGISDSLASDLKLMLLDRKIGRYKGTSAEDGYVGSKLYRIVDTRLDLVF